MILVMCTSYYSVARLGKDLDKLELERKRLQNPVVVVVMVSHLPLIA